MQKQFISKSPLEIQLELTNFCNLKCTHCYRKGTNSSENLDRKSYKDLARKISEWGVFNTILTGGEIFLVRERLKDVLEILTSENITIQINSNLTSLIDEDIKLIKEFNILSILTSIVSYDKRKHNKVVGNSNAFDKLFENINKLKQKGINFGVNMVVYSINEDDVYKTGKLLSKHGVDTFTVGFMVPPYAEKKKQLSLITTIGKRIKILEDLLKVNQETGMAVSTTIPIPYCMVWENKKLVSLLGQNCTAGASTIQIDSFGNVRSCPLYTYNYGNILRDSLDEIWNNLSDWREGKYLPDECKPCDLNYICKGGCRVETEIILDSLKEKSPFSLLPIKLNKKEKKIIEEIPCYINLGQKLKFKESIRYRKENGFYVLSSLPGNYLLASKEEFEILQNLKSKDLIITKDLYYNASLINLLNKAFHAKIIEGGKNG